MQSALWGVLDPAAEFRVAPSGYADTSTDPGRHSTAAKTPFYSPDNGNFGFLVVLTAVAGGLYYVFEHGGAGVGGKAHLGPARAEADAELGGKE